MRVADDLECNSSKAAASSVKVLAHLFKMMQVHSLEGASLSKVSCQLIYLHIFCTIAISTFFAVGLPSVKSAVGFCFRKDQLGRQRVAIDQPRLIQDVQCCAWSFQVPN